MENTEAKTLADTFQKVRDITKWYFSKLKEVDPYKHWEVNGVKLNNIVWLASHLVWAENTLLLKGTGGIPLDISWLNHYNVKSTGTLHDAQHDVKTALHALKAVHEKAMEHLPTLSDADMDKDNANGWSFGEVKTTRIIIQHAIRHEALHSGHLSWLCKINKIKTV